MPYAVGSQGNKGVGFASGSALSVSLLARPQLDEASIQEFLEREHETWRRDDGATTAELLVEFAGRICYMSFGERQSPKSTRRYIRNLIRQGHESVLEHVSWTLLMTGVSRNFTHQLVRHRIGFSYSQLSQQYHDEAGADVVIPGVVADDPELSELWRRTVEDARDSYRTLMRELGRREELAQDHDSRERLRLIRSAARGVLPGNTATKIVVTANARALRHFLRLRGGLTGDEEMRCVSVALTEVLQPEAPAVFEDFRVELAPDGSPIVRWVAPGPAD